MTKHNEFKCINSGTLFSAYISNYFIEHCKNPNENAMRRVETRNKSIRYCPCCGDELQNLACENCGFSFCSKEYHQLVELNPHNKIKGDSFIIKTLMFLFTTPIGIVLMGIVAFLAFPLFFIIPLKMQMKEAQDYLLEMNEEQLVEYVVHANTLRQDTIFQAQHDSMSVGPNGYTKVYRGDDIPKNFNNVGVFRILARETQVFYMWLGGFDHTQLTINFDSSGIAKISVAYSDLAWQKLYPKISPPKGSGLDSKLRKGNLVIKENRLHYLIDSLEKDLNMDNGENRW